MTLRNHVKSYMLQSAEVQRSASESCAVDVLAAADMVASAFKNDGKLLLCGNGGSAADCQHMATEFTNQLTQDFVRPALPAIALTTDTSFLTAYSNDSNYEGVFERQIEALGRPTDVLIGISTSGGSKNVVRAMNAAKALDMKVIALMGSTGPMSDLADVCIRVPSVNTQHIQECHLAIEHLICDLVERKLYASKGKN
jgi:D-sedoheptulose 7-phosphate isomerase